MELKRIIISVSNDLVTDQRVHRHALALQEAGVEVIMLGRERRGSLSMEQRTYATHRFRLFFDSGPLFYAELNIRLFAWFITHKCDSLLANDLDTLPANFIASKLKRCKLFYDSHEYFTGVPELVQRPMTKAVWKFFESWMLPGLRTAFTVNDSIAKMYNESYGVSMAVVRNIPALPQPEVVRSRLELGLPSEHKLILFQGSGINVDRGAEEAIEAMRYVANAVLYFIGGGDVLKQLKKQVKTTGLSDKVRFIDRMHPADLVHYTQNADLGLSLDKNTSINYRYSLPNKLFDYIHASVPVLVSDLPEVAAIVRQYNIGMVSDSHDPLKLGALMEHMLNDPDISTTKANLVRASAELNWPEEKKKLLNIFGLA